MKKLKDYTDKIEWLKKLKKYSHYFKNEKFLKNLNIVKEYIDTFTKAPNSKQYRYLELLCDICSLYDENILDKINEYKNEPKTTNKLKIRYGEGRLEEYIEVLKNKPKGIPNSWTMASYWIKKGYTKEEAEKMRKHKMSIAIKNANNTRRKNNYNYKEKSPLSLDYWTTKGYSLSEAEGMRMPYLNKCKNTLPRYIEDHGEELGTILFNTASNSRKEKLRSRYGTLVVGTHISKESLKVLVKLYRKIRKSGVEKSDIVWGISNNKEFALTDFENKKSFFYDFVVKSKKIIIEYNNSFWHPRKDKEWRGFLDYEETLEKDKAKKELAISRGYTVHYIWDDDNIEEKINEMYLEIMNDRI
jgi:very-short-patch-repair endonuclease